MKLSKVDFKRIIALLERIAYQTSVHSNRLEFEQYLQGVVYASSQRETKRSNGNRRTQSRKAIRKEQGDEEDVPSTAP